MAWFNMRILYITELYPDAKHGLARMTAIGDVDSYIKGVPKEARAKLL